MVTGSDMNSLIVEIPGENSTGMRAAGAFEYAVFFNSHLYKFSIISFWFMQISIFLRL